MKRVLIVDVDLEFHGELRALLVEQGFEVDAVRSAQEAIAIARRSRPSAILADIQLADTNAYALLLKWVSDGELRRIPFLIYSRLLTTPDEALVRSLGAADVVSKRSAPLQVVARARQSMESNTCSDGASVTSDPDRLTALLTDRLVQLQQSNADLLREHAERVQATTTLKQDAERLRLAIQAADIGLWDWDLRTNRVVYSREWKRQLGFSESEISDDYEEWRSRIHPQDLPEWMHRVNDQLSAPRGHFEIDVRMLHRDETYRWLRVRGDVIRDAQGIPSRMLGSHQDITERRQARELIIRERDLSDQIVNSLPGMFYLFDRDGRFLRWNANFERVSGYSAEEMTQRHPLDFFRGADRELIEQRIGRVFADGEADAEATFIAKDGSRYPHYFTGTLIEFDGGPCVIGMAVNIAELSAAREIVIRERDLSEQIVNSLPGVFYLASPTTKLLRWNENFARVTGYSPDELRNLPSMAFVRPEEQAFVAERMRDLFTHSGPVEAEVALVTKDGRAIPYYFLGRAITVDGERCVMGVGLDISERKREEQARLNLEAQLRQAQKMDALGTLAGGIAHDFNNLLSVILGNAHMASDELQEGRARRESIAEIVRAGQRAKELVNRILAFGRPHEQELRTLELEPVLEEATRLLRSTLPAGVELSFRTAGKLPLVRGDASQIQQLILNLATNAWHALEGRPGRVEISSEPYRVTAADVVLRDDVPPGDYVCLTVTDTGKGMDAATRARIFEPFFTTKAPGEGTGLGLSVVHSILRHHDGKIVVSSEPGRGSTFRIFFPITAESLATPVPKTEGPRMRQGSGEKILYLDDEESLVYLAERFLGKLGYDVKGYTRAGDALEAFKSAPQSFDLVITDSNMPGMSGIDVVREMKQVDADVRIVLTSGYLRAEEIERARELGVVEVVLKPNTLEEFGPLVERLLSVRPRDSG